MLKPQSRFTEGQKSLADVDIFAEVEPTKIIEFESKCEWLEFNEDEIVVDQLDTTTGVFFIIAGKLQAMDYLPDDRKVALADLGPGECFGELSAIDSKRRSARVTAKEATLLASMPSNDFKNILLECPVVGLTLLRRFAGIIRIMTTRVTTLSTVTPSQRVYRELLRIAEPSVSGDGTWVIENIPSHTEIATWVGAEREDVADAIGILARNGVVERRHKTFTIKDRARLQSLADQ
jgi:CRP-like cAMP-binding protein